MGNRPADVACLHPIKAVTHRPRQSLARPTPLPLPPSQQLSMACDAICLSACMPQPSPFGTAPRRPRPRGPKGAHLKEETKRNRFPLYSSLIRVLGAEQSAPKDRRKFLEKGAKYGTPTFWHVLDRSCRYNQPCQYSRHAAHISWAGLRADSTWGLHGDEATPSERRALQGD